MQGRCYFFETTSLNFNEAILNCKTAFGAQGGRLFEPRNSIVNDAVWGAAEDVVLNQKWWIGIRRKDCNSHFYYLSSGPFTYLSFGWWQGINPNCDLNLEYCVEMRGGIGEWNDNKCYTTLNSICEMGDEVIW